MIGEYMPPGRPNRRERSRLGGRPGVRVISMRSALEVEGEHSLAASGVSGRPAWRGAASVFLPGPHAERAGKRSLLRLSTACQALSA